VLAAAPQAIGANSHNSFYGISLTGNQQYATRPGGAAATYNRFAEFHALKIARCATPSVKVDEA
jgi:hypothetical protein